MNQGANVADVGTGVTGEGDVKLVVNSNGGEYSEEQKSDFAIAEVMVWDRGLADDEMYVASDNLMNKFGVNGLNSPTTSPSRLIDSLPENFLSRGEMFIIVGPGKCLDRLGRYYGNILLTSDEVSMIQDVETCSSQCFDTVTEMLVGFTYALRDSIHYCFCYYDQGARLPSEVSFAGDGDAEGPVFAADGRGNHVCFKRPQTVRFYPISVSIDNWTTLML